MHINIFYSWQSDLPNKFNRSFIHECLEIAVKNLSNAEVFHIELRVDKDTQDNEGAPDIVHTIFDKIKNCQIFVADISQWFVMIFGWPQCGLKPYKEKGKSLSLWCES